MSDATKPSLIGELPSSKVVCGGYHTCVLTNSGELYTWVQMKMAALVLDQGPFLKSSVSQLSCGWKNTAAISGGNLKWIGSDGFKFYQPEFQPELIRMGNVLLELTWILTNAFPSLSGNFSLTFRRKSVHVGLGRFQWDVL
ncbi:hypothetical protein JHK86_015432 [Glycine max]|nr:hypothetical protein JHK86_015432 [Glycine max]